MRSQKMFSNRQSGGDKYMTLTILKRLAPLLLSMLVCGCVVTGQMAERRGTKAYLLKDYPKAVANYQEAVAEGDANAQYHLAVMYAEGQGVKKNLKKAAELLELATAQDHRDARLMLGLFYIYGDGVTANLEKGAKLIEKSAEEGSDVAMYYMGHLYAAGLGVPKDGAKGLQWFTKARENGFPVNQSIKTEADVEALYKD